MVRRLQHLLSKTRRYAEEIKFCLQIGADFKSKIFLIGATIAFHLHNGFSHSVPVNEAARSYLVRLKDGERLLRLRTYSGDLFVLYEVFLDTVYELPKTILQEIRVVVDLGANIGLTSLYLSQFLPTARFVCVEPSRENMSLLRRNLEHLGNQVEFVFGSIGQTSKQVYFHESPASWGGTVDDCSEGAEPIHCYSVDDLLRMTNVDRVDLMKVDVEGAEKMLFCCKPDWLKKVNAIIIELHEGYGIDHFKEEVSAAYMQVLPAPSYLGNKMTMAIREGHSCFTPKPGPGVVKEN